MEHVVTREKLTELMNREPEVSMHVVGRALVHLKNRQVWDEQSAETTKYDNGRGFTPADARMGTSMAKFYERNRYLSSKQVAYWKRPNVKGTMRLAKYWAQLNEEAEKKALRVNS